MSGFYSKMLINIRNLYVNPPTTKVAGFPPLLWEAAF